MWFILTLIILLLFPVGTLAGDSISGKPHIIDGDTIRIDNTKIRLHGIDAPEAKQTCTDNGMEWHCGEEATLALIRFIGNRRIICKGDKRGRYGRLIAVCYVDSIDLNAKMVRQGWALAYRRYSKDYVDEEAAAKETRLGIWRGEFVPPWEWRRR